MDILNVCDYLNEQFNINMNEQQKQGVLDVQNNTLLLAVPGSGKTTVMVARIANLILNHNTSPRSILTLTFSRESAADMASRFEALFGKVTSHTPKFSTIHSFCYSVLRLYSERYSRPMPKLIEASQRNQILIEINKSVNDSFLGDDGLEQLNNIIGYIKNTCATKSQINKLEDGTDIERINEIYVIYENFKKENSLMDYDDMLEHTLVILRKCKDIFDYYQKMYKYINVDEAQDTSLLQHKIIKKLASKSKIFMVGDEDQSIYNFRGAFPDELLKFEQNYKDAKILKLEQNFRSCIDIVDQSNKFIKISKDRYPKEMFTHNEGKGKIDKVMLNDFRGQFAYTVKVVKDTPKDKTIGIIYRNNESGLLLSKLLFDEQVPIYVKEHKVSLFKSNIIKPVIAFMQFVESPKNIKLFEQLYKRFKISKMSFEVIKGTYHKYNTIMDCVLNEGRMEQSEVNFAVVVKDVMRQVNGKTPCEVVEAFEYQLGYGGFLRWKIESGHSAPNILQKLHIFKEFSKEYSTIEGFLKGIQEFDTTLLKGSDKKNNRITLTTVHSSKGLEFDTVILIDMIDGILPTTSAIEDSENDNQKEMESEARLFYVAVTRAKERLIFYQSSKMYGQQAMSSRFVTRFLRTENKKVVYIKDAKDTDDITNEELKLYERKNVKHSFFGSGVVTCVQGDVATVLFGDEIKQINLKYCITQQLIKEI